MTKCGRCGVTAAKSEIRRGGGWTVVGISSMTKPLSFKELFAAIKQSDGKELCPECSDEVRDFLATPVARCG